MNERAHTRSHGPARAVIRKETRRRTNETAGSYKAVPRSCTNSREIYRRCQEFLLPKKPNCVTQTLLNNSKTRLNGHVVPAYYCSNFTQIL